MRADGLCEAPVQPLCRALGPATTDPITSCAQPTPSPRLLQVGYNALGYLLLRFTKPRYLPLTSSAAAAKRKRA